MVNLALIVLLWKMAHITVKLSIVGKMKITIDLQHIDLEYTLGRNGVMVSASDCHPKDRSSIPGQDTLVSTAVSQGESI